MQRTKVSIIVPTFNRATFLPESIASALNQTRKPDEILIVDDGSTDDTPGLAQSFANPVRYVRQENAGKSAALNRGLAETQGDLLLVLDDDDLLPATAIQSHVTSLEANRDAGFSYGRFARFSGDGRVAHLSRDFEPLSSRCEKRLLVQLMERCFLPNPSWMVRRDCQQAVGPYRTDLPRGQDYEMILRIARRWSGVFTDDVTLYQRKHVASRQTKRGNVTARDTVQGWIDAEKQIFAEIDEEWGDADFSPFPQGAEGKDAERLAVLQRGVVMFMRKVYDRAEFHLGRYSSMLDAEEPARAEVEIARAFFGSRYGVNDLADSPASLAWVKPLDLPYALRRAMAGQLPWRFKDLILTGRGDVARNLVVNASRSLGHLALLQAAADRILRSPLTVRETGRDPVAPAPAILTKL